MPADSTPPKVAICVPTHNKCHAMFAYDLANLLGFTGSVAIPQGVVEGVSLNFVTGTYVHTARQELADEALKQGADYVLWLDSDMRFPKTALLHLLARDEPFIGANYSTRGMPPNYVAAKTVGWDDAADAEKCATGPDSEGVEEVEAMGFGVVLMKREVLEALHDPTGEEGPWFWYEWRPQIEDQVGEDVYFCRLAREAGYPPKVDHDLSRVCSHIGDFEYRTDAVHGFQESLEPDEPLVEVVS